MVARAACPYCGSIPEQPVLFTFKLQRVFRYIWENPNSTTGEIAREFFQGDSQSVNVSMSKIRQRLRSTVYELRAEPDPNYRGDGSRPQSRYKIVEMKAVAQ